MPSFDGDPTGRDPEHASLVCENVRELLPRRLDDDLGPSEAAALERHLGECPACRDEARGLERAAEALRGLPADERARLRERTYRELGLEDPSFRGRSRLRRVVLLAIGFALVYAWIRSRPPGAPLIDRPGTDSRQDTR